ncbi:hypothetical protein DSO57_1005868 [Entomophthora muscae]|uniref:Uncharacterized protein n=1 Tax=Entomophthora muscae TaxID=34485 RepID=A0ACC2RMI4_9FUNG|nr:hypothetical protein DSO57_1005868 [Entomophthora muscae]
MVYSSVQVEYLNMSSSFEYLTSIVFPVVAGADFPSVKKACDCCRDRKIRCIQAHYIKCYNCRSKDLDCTYEYKYKAKGRKSVVRNKATTKPPTLPAKKPYKFIIERPQDSKARKIVCAPDLPQVSSSPPQFSANDFSIPQFKGLEKYSLSMGFFN